MSKITVKQIKCPCCGSSLSLKDEGYGETKCSYCNAIVFVSREDTNEKGDMNIYNIGDNKPLGKINIPLGWDITNTFIDYNRSTLQKPYAFGFDLSNNMGSEIFVESGPSYFIQGPVLTRNEQIPYTFQKEYCSQLLCFWQDKPVYTQKSLSYSQDMINKFKKLRKKHLKKLNLIMKIYVEMKK